MSFLEQRQLLKCPKEWTGLGFLIRTRDPHFPPMIVKPSRPHASACMHACQRMQLERATALPLTPRGNATCGKEKTYLETRVKRDQHSKKQKQKRPVVDLTIVIAILLLSPFHSELEDAILFDRSASKGP